MDDFKPDFTPHQLHGMGVYHRLYGDGKRLASQKSWPDKWINPQDPKGWLQWYERYNRGRRTDDDERQMKRWKAFKSRHGGPFSKRPTPKRAQALINWGIDPRLLVSESQRAEVEFMLNEDIDMPKTAGIIVDEEARKKIDAGKQRRSQPGEFGSMLFDANKRNAWLNKETHKDMRQHRNNLTSGVAGGALGALSGAFLGSKVNSRGVGAVMGALGGAHLGRKAHAKVTGYNPNDNLYVRGLDSHNKSKALISPLNNALKSQQALDRVVAKRMFEGVSKAKAERMSKQASAPKEDKNSKKDQAKAVAGGAVGGAAVGVIESTTKDTRENAKRVASNADRHRKFNREAQEWAAGAKINPKAAGPMPKLAPERKLISVRKARKNMGRRGAIGAAAGAAAMYGLTKTKWLKKKREENQAKKEASLVGNAMTGAGIAAVPALVGGAMGRRKFKKEGDDIDRTMIGGDKNTYGKMKGVRRGALAGAATTGTQALGNALIRKGGKLGNIGQAVGLAGDAAGILGATYLGYRTARDETVKNYKKQRKDLNKLYKGKMTKEGQFAFEDEWFDKAIDDAKSGKSAKDQATLMGSLGLMAGSGLPLFHGLERNKAVRGGYATPGTKLISRRGLLRRGAVGGALGAAALAIPTYLHTNSDKYREHEVEVLKREKERARKEGESYVP